MPEKVMLSFCFTETPRLVLGVTDFTDFRWVDIQTEVPVRGATGIAVGEQRIFVGTQHMDKKRSAAIAVLRPDLSTERYHLLAGVHDIHSLCWHEGYVYIADSGHNRIVRVPYTGRFGPEEVVWQAIEDTSRDSVHVNSVYFHGDTLYATMFGYKELSEDFFMHGSLVNVTTGERLVKDLAEPHSVYADDNEVTFLESPRRLVHTDSASGKRVFSTGNAYLRGYATTADRRYICGSGTRRIEKNSGAPKKDKPSTNERRSYVYVLDKEWRSVALHETTAWGQELFDVCPLPSWASFETNPQSTRSAIVRRVLTLDDRLGEVQERLWHCETT